MKKEVGKNLLLLFTLALSFISIGQIWLVQLSSYPLWSYVGTTELHNYHIAWWHSIWIPVFVPAGLSFICTSIMLWFRPFAIPRSLIWIAVVILFLTYVGTYFWWAPLMALIGSTPEEFKSVFNWAPYLTYFKWQNKSQLQLYNLLLSTHWCRVILITVHGILIFYAAVIAFKLKKIKIFP